MNPIERQCDIVAAHFAAVNAHDWKAVVRTFTGQWPTFDHIPANLRMNGFNGIDEAYQVIGRALPDLKVRIEGGFDVPGCSVREIVIAGTHLGPYHGFKPSGRTVQFACACFFLFDEHTHLHTLRCYFDNETVLRQMRGVAEPYFPPHLRIAA